MQRLENVIYNEKPKRIVVSPTIVDVCLSSKKVEIIDDISGDRSIKWECTIERYTSNEYIAVLQAKNDILEQQMTQAQEGIVEVYEMLLNSSVS